MFLFIHHYCQKLKDNRCTEEKHNIDGTWVLEIALIECLWQQTTFMQFLFTSEVVRWLFCTIKNVWNIKYLMYWKVGTLKVGQFVVKKSNPDSRPETKAPHHHHHHHPSKNIAREIGFYKCIKRNLDFKIWKLLQNKYSRLWKPNC